VFTHRMQEAVRFAGSSRLRFRIRGQLIKYRNKLQKLFRNGKLRDVPDLPIFFCTLYRECRGWTGCTALRRGTVDYVQWAQAVFDLFPTWGGEAPLRIP